VTKRRASFHLKFKKSAPGELRFSVYKDADGQYRWKLTGKNNRIVADSGEGYHNEADALSGVILVMSATAETAVVDRTAAV